MVLLNIVIYALIFMFGASVFSFVNVLIYRVPRHLPFGNERSFCPSCGNMLKGYDMVPVFSYLVLGGKCRFCKERISMRYPVIELMGGLMAVFTFHYYGYDGMYSLKVFGQVGIVFSILALLTAVAFVDIDTMEIPNGFVIAILICGILSMLFFPELSLSSRAIGIFSISVPLALITFAVPGAFGGGDIKLMAALGIFLGWKLSIVAFFLAVLTGGSYGIYLLASRKKGRKEHFAFGPFLCVGTAVSIFYGYQWIDWYLGFLR